VILRTSLVSYAVLSTLALAATGCAVAHDATSDASLYDIASHGRAFRSMRLGQPADAEASSEAPSVLDGSLPTTSPSGAHLEDYGGPVLVNVEVVPVYWSAGVAHQTELDAFYASFPSSSFYDMLAQYRSIGRGTSGTSFVANQSSTTVSDADIQAALRAMFDAGQVAKPDANSYYPVHFPPGVSVTDPSGDRSCVQFCAYHGTFQYNGLDVSYGVIPDQGGGCAGGCGSNFQRVNNLTSVASHELVEATTDPGVGLAAGYASPLAWYDQTNGEIGDICNAQQVTIFAADGSTLVVQKEFSNADSNCTWGVVDEHRLPMDGTCHSPGTVLAQHSLETLVFQTDGNLVLYKTTSGTPKSVWATGTNGKGATSVCLQADGNLVVKGGGRALWTSNTGGSGSTTLGLQTDCDLVLSSAQHAAMWSTRTSPCN
jgi:hypothetical protein